MASLNKVTLIGNLGADPEVRSFPSGDKVANVSLATTEKYKSKDGQVKEETEWHRVEFWGGLAEIVDKYLKKGDSVYVEGKIKTEEYEKDGIKRYSTKIRATQMQMLGKRSESATPATPDPSTVTNDDDLPF
ncbi:single-stranded DNA-binding protein [Leadbetterella byssophila]|uniref:single-stranded DNA-binding protein n=1 Tax=Leadbetterella byssophila TaxID=316068 RepID=UPI00399FDA36